MTTIPDEQLIVDHPVGPQGRLAVRLASAQLRLVGSDTDRITVRSLDGRSLGGRISIGTADGEVTIGEKDLLGIVLATGPRTVRLEITVPVEAGVTLEIASGDLEAAGLRGDQHYRTASGDLALTDVAGRVEVTTVSGDATVELVAATELQVRSVSGDVAVAGGSLTAVRVTTTSGDVRLGSPLVGTGDSQIDTLSGDVSVAVVAGIRVEARTVSGDLMSDLPHRTEGRMGRRTLIVGDGAVRLGFRSVSGDLFIRAAGAEGVASSRATESTGASSRATDAPASPAASPSPAAATPTPNDASATDGNEDDRMAVLRALERGDLDVAAAMDRLAALDDRDDFGPSSNMAVL
jgi:hypothetical protein